MSWVDNTIKIGDMVIRAYAWETEELGLVIDVKRGYGWVGPTRDNDEDTSEEDEYADMGDVETFTILWPSGNLSEEMDVELYSFAYYLKSIVGSNNEREDVYEKR